MLEFPRRFLYPTYVAEREATGVKWKGKTSEVPGIAGLEYAREQTRRWIAYVALGGLLALLSLILLIGLSHPPSLLYARSNL